MFRAVCLTIIAFTTVASLWLSFVTQEEYDRTVDTASSFVSDIEEKVWDKIAAHMEQREKIAELQEKDMRFVRAYLRSRLGSDAYLELAENNCLDSIVYKLAIFDSKWIDNWCANQYRSIERWYKNDIMLYMSYRYEAAQPETLKRSIKVARQQGN